MSISPKDLIGTDQIILTVQLPEEMLVLTNKKLIRRYNIASGGDFYCVPLCNISSVTKQSVTLIIRERNNHHLEIRPVSRGIVAKTMPADLERLFVELVRRIG